MKVETKMWLIMTGLLVAWIYCFPVEVAYGQAPMNLPRIPISAVPYQINTPGSYYLTGDLQVTNPNENGIDVNACNVTIDLMGYSLVGTGFGITPGFGSGCGIFIHAQGNVEIRNGTIRHFGDTGIYEPGVEGPNNAPHYGYSHRIIDVRVEINGFQGIYLGGQNHLAEGCIVKANTVNGVYMGDSSSAFDNIISEHEVFGLATGSGCTIRGNTVNMHFAFGIEAGPGCTVLGNTVTDSYNGIVALEGCNVIDNTATHNDWYGIYLYGDGNMAKRNTLRNNTESNICVDGMYNAIEENLVTGAKVGIDFAQDDNYYANNRALGNTTNYQNIVGQTDGGGNVSIF